MTRLTPLLFVLSPADILDVGPPPAAYSQIQTAVQAASPGDVVRVAHGTYLHVTVTAKSLTIIPAQENGSYNIAGTLRVQGIDAAGSVLVVGANPTASTAPSTIPKTALAVGENSGSVRFEDCTFTGTHGRAGAIQDSADVAFSNCTFYAGGLPDPWGHGPYGDTALTIGRSAVLFADTDCFGGTSLHYAADGGDGIASYDSALFFTGGEIYGGDGGPDRCFGSFLPPGSGGQGLYASDSSIDYVGTTFTGGNAGPSFGGGACGLGSNGTAIGGPNANIADLGGEALTFDATSVAVEHDAVSITASGDPGDVILLLFGPEPALLSVPGIGGMLAVGGPHGTVRRALLGTSPVMTQIIAPNVAPFEIQSWTLQTYHLRAVGDYVLGPTRRLTVLDDAL